MPLTTSIRKNPAKPLAAPACAPRRRLAPQERERLIVQGAVRFFSDHGLQGQLRDLAKSLGITHTLMYHYFPTKQALIERVYTDLFAARWRPEWETLLDDELLDAETKLTRFYSEYAKVILERDWVRVFVSSGLSDRYITDRYFALLGEKLFPRLVRVSHQFCGQTSNRKSSKRELELLMGLHGSIFYMGMRRWIYGHGQEIDSESAPDTGESLWNEVSIHDRVRGYLLALSEFQGETTQKNLALAPFEKFNQVTPWPYH